MKLNIKRFDTTYTQYYPSYEPTYTPKGYLRSNKVTIECDYDVTQVLLCLGQALDDNLVDVTSEWIIEDNVISKNFTEPQNNEQYVVRFENSQYGIYGYFILSIADDFTPDSEKYPVEINHDVKISDSDTKLKNVADVVENYFNILYPVGSIYKTTSNTIPFEKGTWTKISEQPDRISVGSQVIYGGTSGSGNVSKTSVYGAYGYSLIDGVFANTTAPAGYHKEYRLSFQGTTGTGNTIVCYINNIVTSDVLTYSANTFRKIGMSNYFKESDIVLETTKGYSQQGTNLHYAVTGTSGTWAFTDVTIHGFYVSNDTWYTWKRTA